MASPANGAPAWPKPSGLLSLSMLCTLWWAWVGLGFRGPPGRGQDREGGALQASQPHPRCAAWSQLLQLSELQPHRTPSRSAGLTRLGWHRGDLEVPSGGASVGCPRGLLGVLPSRLCPFLPLIPAPVSLPSLRHLRPLQLRHHPPSEHRGRRVDDVSGWWGGGRVGSGRWAGPHLLYTLPPSVFLVPGQARGTPGQARGTPTQAPTGFRAGVTNVF